MSIRDDIVLPNKEFRKAEGIARDKINTKVNYIQANLTKYL